MNNNDFSNAGVTTTQTGIASAIAFGMRASGAYAPAATELPCSFAGSAMGGTTPVRHADRAKKHNPGTLAWSPPT